MRLDCCFQVWMSVSGAQKKLRENQGIYEAILAREDSRCLFSVSRCRCHSCVLLVALSSVFFSVSLYQHHSYHSVGRVVRECPPLRHSYSVCTCKMPLWLEDTTLFGEIDNKLHQSPLSFFCSSHQLADHHKKFAHPMKNDELAPTSPGKFCILMIFVVSVFP